MFIKLKYARQLKIKFEKIEIKNIAIKQIQFRKKLTEKIKKNEKRKN